VIALINRWLYRRSTDDADVKLPEEALKARIELELEGGFSLYDNQPPAVGAVEPPVFEKLLPDESTRLTKIKKVEKKDRKASDLTPQVPVEQ